MIAAKPQEKIQNCRGSNNSPFSLGKRLHSWVGYLSRFPIKRQQCNHMIANALTSGIHSHLWSADPIVIDCQIQRADLLSSVTTMEMICNSQKKKSRISWSLSTTTYIMDYNTASSITISCLTTKKKKETCDWSNILLHGEDSIPIDCRTLQSEH